MSRSVSSLLGLGEMLSYGQLSLFLKMGGRMWIIEVASPSLWGVFFFINKKIRGGNSRCVQYPALEKVELDFLFPFSSYHTTK